MSEEQLKIRYRVFCPPLASHMIIGLYFLLVLFFLFFVVGIIMVKRRTKNLPIEIERVDTIEANETNKSSY